MNALETFIDALIASDPNSRRGIGPKSEFAARLSRMHDVAHATFVYADKARWDYTYYSGERGSL
jgi:hypothetical protein